MRGRTCGKIKRGCAKICILSFVVIVQFASSYRKPLDAVKVLTKDYQHCRYLCTSVQSAQNAILLLDHFACVSYPTSSAGVV